MPKPYKTNDELIREWFADNQDFGVSYPVRIDFIEHHDLGSNYRIETVDGRVADYNVHYEEDTVVDITEYNVVIERG